MRAAQHGYVGKLYAVERNRLPHKPIAKSID
jgi:hypothetical protein